MQELASLSKGLLEAQTLDEVCTLAVDKAMMLLKSEFAQILLPERGTNDLVFAATAGWPNHIKGTRLPPGNRSHAGFTIEKGGPVPIEDYAAEDRCGAPLAEPYGIRAGLSVPICRDNQVVGALLVAYQQVRKHQQSDIALLQLIAHETAIALQSVERHGALQRKNAYMNALLDASRAITQGNLSSARSLILNQIVKHAVLCVGKGRQTSSGVGLIQLYDGATHRLRFESKYPLAKAVTGAFTVGTERIICGPDRAAPIGITGRAALTGIAQCVPDVEQDPDYLRFDPETKTEISVPLRDGNCVVGVLSVESNKAAAFDDDDLGTLLTFAQLAVIVIQNLRQYEELRHTYEELKATKGLVGARTALAWMGMASNIWWHQVRMQAVTIRERAKLMARHLESHALTPPVQESLALIMQTAAAIEDRPITPPLSSEEGVSDVEVSTFVRERVSQRVSQLKEFPPYRSVVLAASHTTQPLWVRCSREWLRRAVDILIDNAVTASLLVDVSKRVIVVSTGLSADKVEIAVCDHGQGICDNILAQLFEGQVKPHSNGKGLGMGLLMAQAIVETYGGTIDVRSTGCDGTTMVISLPGTIQTARHG